MLPKILERWMQWWLSLGNTQRSGTANPAKAECVNPIPNATALEFSSNDSSNTTSLYTPLKSGFIRGTVVAPSGVPVISAAATGTTRQQLIATGAWGVVVNIYNNHASDATNPVLLNADAAEADTNRLYRYGGTGLATGESLPNPLTGAVLQGPVWLLAATGGNAIATVQPYAQIRQYTT